MAGLKTGRSNRYVDRFDFLFDADSIARQGFDIALEATEAEAQIVREQEYWAVVYQDEYMSQREQMCSLSICSAC